MKNRIYKLLLALLLFFFSTGLQVFAQTYCTPTYTNGCGSSGGDAVTRVRIVGTTLDNSSTCSNPAYTFYGSVLAPNLGIGASYSVNVTMGSDSYQYARIWFDWNRDGDFEDTGEDAGGNTANAGSNGTAQISVIVPSSATVGTVRMRVRGGHDSPVSSSGSCSSVSWGEAEDYNVNLVACSPAQLSRNPVNASAACASTATFTVAATGLNPNFTWQYRTSSTSSWQNLSSTPIGSPVVPGVVVVAINSTLDTLNLSNVPSSWNGYQVRAIVSGACNPGPQEFSNPATLTVIPPTPTVTPTSASICKGGSGSIALTNLVSQENTNTYTSGTISVPIPESPTGSLSALNVLNVNDIPSNAIITGVSVTLNITHTWVGDVVVALKAPNGAILNLDYALSGTGGATFTAGFTNTVISSKGTASLSSGATPFTGTFKADAALTLPGYVPAGPVGYNPTTQSWSSLYSTPNGNWTLALFDFEDYWGDSGSLTNWRLNITYTVPTYAEGVWTANPSTPNSLFLDAALTQPYNGTSSVNKLYVNPLVNTVYSVSFTNPITLCPSSVAAIPFAVGAPITNLTAPATADVCVGSAFTIKAKHDPVPSGNAPAIYQWQSSADGGVTWSNISGATDTVLTVATSTQSMSGRRYRISVTSGGCATVSSTPTVLTVNPLPTVTLSAPATTLTPGKAITITGTSSPAAATWTWKLNGATIAGTTNTQVVNVDGLGTYQATVVDVKGCVNTSNTLTFTADASDKLWIYPNPTTGAFQIRYYHAGDANEKRIISVYNAAGQLVASKSFDLTYTSAPYLRMDVDLSGASRGTYVVKVAHEYSGKIVSGLVLVQ